MELVNWKNANPTIGEHGFLGSKSVKNQNKDEVEKDADGNELYAFDKKEENISFFDSENEEKGEHQ